MAFAKSRILKSDGKHFRTRLPDSGMPRRTKVCACLQDLRIQPQSPERGADATDSSSEPLSTTITRREM